MAACTRFTWHCLHACWMATCSGCGDTCCTGVGPRHGASWWLVSCGGMEAQPLSFNMVLTGHACLWPDRCGSNLLLATACYNHCLGGLSHMVMSNSVLQRWSTSCLGVGFEVEDFQAKALHNFMLWLAIVMFLVPCSSVEALLWGPKTPRLSYVDVVFLLWGIAPENIPLLPSALLVFCGMHGDVCLPMLWWFC